MTDKQGLPASMPSQRNLLIFTGCMAILLMAATVIFGFRVLAIAAVSYAVSLTIELIFVKVRKHPLDASLLVTPIVLALLMPPTVPLWMVGVGAAFGIFFGKCLFGGSGRNIFNPAIVGVLFMTISFPQQMATRWLNPQTDAVSAATPLTDLNSGIPFDYAIRDLFLGAVPGTLGETFRLGIIILGIALIVLKVIDWRIPVFFIGTVFVVTGIGHFINADLFVDPFMSMIVGGLLFGAFFVATDPVTSPMHANGRIIYAIGLGLLTVLIRNFAAFPEGVTFSVIIMNAVTPLIDNWRAIGNDRETEEAVE